MAERAELLGILGADVRLGAGATPQWPPDLGDVDVLVTSPGFPPGRAAGRGGPRRGACRSGARSSWPGGCATRTTRRPGSRSPAPTARPPPCRCWTRSCARPACAATPSATSGRPVVEAVMDPEPYDVLAVELSSFQLHYVDVGAGGVGRGAQPRRGPPRLVHRSHRDGRLHRRQGPDLPGRAARLRLQRPGPGDRGPGARRRRRGGRARDRLHPRGARRRHARPGRRRARRPGVHRRAAQQRGRALHARRPPVAGPAPGRERVGRRRAGPGARGLAAGGPRRAARLPTRRAPDQQCRRRSTACTYVDDSKATNPHAARASLQAYDPVVWVAGGLAKGASFDDLVQTVRWLGCVAWCCSAATATSSRARFRDTRPMCRSSSWATVRLRHPWNVPWPPPRVSPTRATPCCWPRAAPPWTCSPTTALAATRSPRRCGGCRDRRADGRGAAPPMTTANPETSRPASPARLGLLTVRAHGVRRRCATRSTGR